MINWIKQNKHFLRIGRIEKALKMPPTTLVKELDNSQPMAEKWHKPLNKFVKKLKQ